MQTLKPLGETRTHFWLAQRMARLGGLDLAAASARGMLDQRSWAEMVRRCRGCGWVKGCHRVLAGGASGGTVPRNCRNGEVFSALSREMKTEETQ